MNAGIVFFLDGTAMAPLLAVSLHSLRKHYSGPIHVCFGPYHETWMLDELAAAGISCSVLPAMAEDVKKHNQRCWFSKPLVHQQSPFDVTLLYDVDHVFVDTFDHAVFEAIKQQEFLTCHNSRHKTQRAIELAEEFPDDKEVLLAKHQSTNGGCVGSLKGSKFIEQWKNALEIVRKAITRINKAADEHAMAYVMAINNLPIYDGKYSTVIGKYSDHNEKPALAYHMVRGRWRDHPIYKAAFQDAWNDNFLRLQTAELYKGCESYLLDKLSR